QFTLRLPRIAAPVEQQATPASMVDSVPGTGLRVLVVDDNVDAANTMAMLLEAAGYRVAVAHAPQEALRRAQAEAFDACLLDIGLPGMDGHELAGRLRALPATGGALLLAVTGYGQNDAEQAGSAFDHYLLKPADPVQLFALLGQHAMTRGG
ncbi:MAG TPA: diguanylate cyclase, partial [Massilia sp.]|nr:diguanylate cyclase [Massilia sp.]